MLKNNCEMDSNVLQWWNKRNLSRLIAIQFGVPTIVHLYYIVAEIDWEFRDGVQAYDGMAETVGLVNRFIKRVVPLLLSVESTRIWRNLRRLCIRKHSSQWTHCAKTAEIDKTEG